MIRTPRRTLAAAAVLALLAVGCTATSEDLADGDGADHDEVTAVVHRTATCGCCVAYEEFLAARGFEVVEEVHADLDVVKDAFGVPVSERSCHTTEIGGYVVEGHVPMLAIRKLLDQRPDIDGIALAGMPVGSPGMPGEQAAPLVVTALVDGEVVGEFGTY